MLTQQLAQSIDEVIARLADIIDVSDISRQESSRLGYFAARYRKVTASVKQGILDERFEDGARHHCLANRRLRMIFSKAGL
jgi:hypothetical protein